MNLQNKVERLRNYLRQVTPNEILEQPKSDLESMTQQESPGLELVSGGLEKIAENRPLKEAEVAGLEAIVHTQFRPAIYIIRDTYDKPPAPWEKLANAEIRERIETALLSIGRIELPGMATIPFGGTGFVVGKNLIMTNRHVAEIFARGIGQKNLAFRSRSSAINFRREVVPSPDVRNLWVQKVVMIHPYWDMALLQVDGLLEQQKPLTLSTQHPEELDGQEAVVIGYPAQDPRNDLELQKRIFGDVFDVKRLQPGVLRERRKIASFGNVVDAITHDASTLAGNSGSAVLDLSTGNVAALHFAGSYLDANFAVPAYELARDARVVDAGVTFASLVQSTEDWGHHWKMVEQPVEASPSSVANPTRTASGKNAQATVSGNAVTWTIPLTISVTLGTPEIHVSPPCQTSQPISSEGREGLFGENVQQIIDRAYRQASAASLAGGGFSWGAALVAGCASHLAYKSAEEVERVSTVDWGFDESNFIKVADTECFVNSGPNEVLLTFRGTAGTADWIRNLTLFSIESDYGSLHQGFYSGFQLVKAQVTALLDRCRAKEKKLVLSGHSLGGALATIAAAELDDEFTVDGVYTFGQPAVGKTDFKAWMQRLVNRFYRIVNDDDIVAKVPPGYMHVGKLYRFGWRGVFRESVVGLDKRDEEIATLSEAEFRNLQELCARTAEQESLNQPGLEGILPIPSLRDHKLHRYLQNTLQQFT